MPDQTRTVAIHYTRDVGPSRLRKYEIKTNCTKKELWRYIVGMYGKAGLDRVEIIKGP